MKRTITYNYTGHVYHDLPDIAQLCCDCADTPEEAESLFLEESGEATGVECFAFAYDEFQDDYI